MKIFSKLAAVATVATMSLALSACGGGAEKEAAKAPAAKDSELTVFAAASLNKAFPEIEQTLLKDSGIKIKFSFEGSSTLVEQMKQGAKADVFASADEKNMNKAKEADLVQTPQAFASNVLTLIVPKGNPGKITGLNDSLKGKKLVVCAVGVPCGNATKKLAEVLGVKLTPASEEQKVTDVRAKVETGEADAGLVYQTDAKAAGDKVEIIPVKGSDQVVNVYPIALTKTPPNAAGAEKFMKAVLSPEGQKILAKYGFEPAPAAKK